MFVILEKYQWISLHNRSASLKKKILSLSHWFLPIWKSSGEGGELWPVLRWSRWRLLDWGFGWSSVLDSRSIADNVGVPV